MIKHNEELTLEELVQKRDGINANCEGWKKCQDGSYEMALHYAGYHDVVAEIKRRETAKNG